MVGCGWKQETLFIKYGKAVYCLWWAVAGNKKHCLVNMGTVNQDVTVVKLMP
jgi:hypothetical protein